ncbi:MULTISPECIES: replication initiator protein A [Fusobacterium]|jgi:hypothetical protein|uniref:replication initiator protein A n=1 Tax=Fusobacterium TaxID=848 RepID=UPI000C709DD2|nr:MULTISPECIES: replication initiator protein A [Fusobacterium]
MKKGELKNDSELDSFNIIKTGSLADDIKNIDIQLTSSPEIEVKQVPEIEVKEVIIKETGNFLNLKDNIINIPVEMIVFPFFTPQKQNKKVNFQYSFQDLGVTMSCTLIAKDINDKVFQPSIFEEKIYTYLISMYEMKKEQNNTDDYIEFEISDFIVNFLGNKMNRTYYTKVEQALKNMKNTEYQFVVSNHTKLGKYRFEDEEFKLLTYQKLERGRRKFYRVTLNKNIRQKIKDKRYIKYNSRSLLEILTKDPIAGRIYKYISKIRYDKEFDSINLRTLAAIIPLKTEQITERTNKNGEVKQYVLSRLKQVLKRVCKAFDILLEMGYIIKYTSKYIKAEDTYYIDYVFNKDRDGECHVSSYIEMKQPKNNYFPKPDEDISEAEIIEEIEIIEEKTKPKTKKNDDFEFPDSILDGIKKAKRNIYVSKAWDKRTDTKIKKIFVEEGEERAKEILGILYTLKENIKTTLVQYINGVLKNLSQKDKSGSKQNLTLFGNVVKGKGLKTKNRINRARKASKRTVATDLIDENDLPLDILEEFEKYDEYEKLKIEEKALKICAAENGADEKFLLVMKNQAEKLYIDSLKPFIEKVIKEMKEEEK